MPTNSSAPATRSRTTQSSVPRVRKDVLRNRAHLLEAADKLIAERGLGITFHELASAAGVGVGTVYRHFADKDALLAALIDDRFDTAQEILLAAEQLDDPVDALREAILGVCELQQNDRGIWQAMLSNAEAHRGLAREKLVPVSARIVQRALATGRIRSDLSVTDLPMIFWLSGALSKYTADVRPDLWRRYVSALLAGFMIDDRVHDRPDAPPLTDQEVENVLEGSKP
jgi:AcrR family transcriptional regulator